MRHVEADHEAVISSLVIAGIGVALMREDIARAHAAAGELFVWDDARLATLLSFIYRRDRERDPPIHALRDVVRDVWNARRTGARRSGRPVRKATAPR
jgi:DNA-binding transcriptional LysR family regulator